MPNANRTRAIMTALKCPRCLRYDDTVLLDTDNEPYMCDDCWENDN